MQLPERIYISQLFFVPNIRAAQLLTAGNLSYRDGYVLCVYRMSQIHNTSRVLSYIKICSLHDIAEILLMLALNTNQSIIIPPKNKTLIGDSWLRMFNTLYKKVQLPMIYGSSRSGIGNLVVGKLRSPDFFRQSNYVM
jgi:hypothetical protein